MALTDKLTAIADAIRAKTGKTDALTLAQMPSEIEGIQSGSNIPDGTNVTFGKVNGHPVARETVYAIKSDDLSEMGGIVQRSLKTDSLVTVGEMVSYFKIAELLPVGHADSTWNASQLMVFDSNAVGTLEG